MTARARLVGILFVTTVLIAGCLGGGSTTPTQSPVDTIADGAVPDAGRLQNETLAAMKNVSAYTAEQSATIVQRASSPNRTTKLEVEYAVNRTTRSLVAHRTTTQVGRQVLTDRYVVNQTLYQRSSQFVDVYGSAWIRQDISENFDAQWQLFDQLWRYKFVLGNASLSSVERGIVDGTQVYVVTADVDTAEFNTAIRDKLDMPPDYAGVSGNTTLSATFWIDTETYRPIQVQRTVSGNETVEGESVEFEREIQTRLTYEPVAVTLPAGASEGRRIETE